MYSNLHLVRLICQLNNRTIQNVYSAGKWFINPFFNFEPLYFREKQADRLTAARFVVYLKCQRRCALRVRKLTPEATKLLSLFLGFRLECLGSMKPSLALGNSTRTKSSCRSVYS